MDLEAFQEVAYEVFESIPEEFREGIDGLTVRAESLPHPTLPGVYTLGECITESYLSDWTGPDTMRSLVVIYFGSFHALAEMDPEFDWEGELWETVTHELRHHLESLASDDALEEEDHALEEAFRREEGEPFDPLYYRWGREVAPGVFQVEQDFFLEQSWDEESFQQTPVIEFVLEGQVYQIHRPAELGDIHFIWLEGLGGTPGFVQLVLRRRLRWKERVEWLTGELELDVLESAAKPVRV